MSVLPIFALTPDQGGYGAQDGQSVLATKLKGGLGRYRSDQLGTSIMATVQYTLDTAGYQYARAFFRTTVTKGSLPFQAVLMLDDYLTEPYKCYFVPGSDADGFRLVSTQGLTYVIAATFEGVQITPSDPDTDTSIVALYSAFGSSSSQSLVDLSTLVNTIMPTL
jgi:hypothetical protein